MQESFWLDSWRNRNIGFHQAAVHPALLQYWPGVAVASSVLVPLCGKTLDMLWLAKRGHDVVGVELAEAAELVRLWCDQLQLLGHCDARDKLPGGSALSQLDETWWSLCP
jgi:hypothetical protein